MTHGLTKGEEDLLIKASNFEQILEAALLELEREDKYRVSERLRNLSTALIKIVAGTRANIYSQRLEAARAKTK